MTDPNQPRHSIEQVLSDLEKRRPVFGSFCEELSAHIKKCLRDDQIAFQDVQWRVKSATKVESKYQAPHKANRYDRLDDLTDIAALRIVTYYEDEVDVIKSIIEREFLIDWENCQDKRIPENPESFTYSALHLVVSLKPETLGNRAHKQFEGLRAEIQITTSLRHAWAEIEHKWYDLWDAFPPKAKRRFARLSALIEMADQEFVNLRKEFDAGNESAGVLVGSDENTPIDAQSLRAFIQQESTVREIDGEIADAMKVGVNPEISESSASFVEECLGPTSIDTIAKLRDTLSLNRDKLIELVGQFNSSESAIGPGYCILMLAVFLNTGQLQPAPHRSP